MGLALLALCALAVTAAADGPLPSMISFGTSEKYVSLYGKGGPKSERFTMQGRMALMGEGRRLFGGGYAGTCQGLPADYGAAAKNTPRYLYRLGENISLAFTCKYSLWMVKVTMMSTSNFSDGLLTLKASAEFARPDGKLTGRGEEEAVIDLANGKCVVKKYRRFDAVYRMEEYSTKREETDTAPPNIACVRMR